MRRKIESSISLSDQQKKMINDEITAFYYDIRDEEIGIIEKQQIYDLFMDTIAPIIYDKALDDALRWLKTQQANQENDYILLYKDVNH